MAYTAIWLKHGTRAALSASTPLHQAEPFLATDADNQALLVGIGDGNNVECMNTSKYARGTSENTNKVDRCLLADIATNANNAANATEAAHATEADHATNATSAVGAQSALTANTANSATTAACASSVTSDVVSQIMQSMYPVGSIKLSTVNTSPATYIPGTVWVAWGSGRVPVGVDSAQTEFATSEKTGGEKTHILTESEMPTHVHNGSSNYLDGASMGGVSNRTVLCAGGGFKAYWAVTDTAGGGQAHQNLQPYITCYMWKRTA